MKASFCSNRVKFFITALLISSAAAVSHADTAGGWWHTDMLRGFSLYVPARASSVQPISSLELLRLKLKTAGDGKSPAYISVLRAREQSGNFDDLDSFAAGLMKTLSQENFRLDSAAANPKRLKISGKSAIMLTGKSGSETNAIARCDIWIQVAENNYLVLRASGPHSASYDIASAIESVAASIQFFDPVAARVKLQANLDAGAQAVASLRSDKLQKIAAAGQLWYAVMNNDRPVGFVRADYNFENYESKPAIRTSVMSLVRDTSGEGFNAVFENCLYCPASKVEKWEITFAVKNADGKVSKTMLNALRQQNMLLLQYFGGNKDGLNTTVTLPAGGYVLPKAFFWSPAVLMDITGGKTAAFAQFNNMTESFDMRSIDIAGPTEISLGGRAFNAIELHDSSTIGAPATKVFVDTDGHLLKMVSHDGQVIQQTTEAAIKNLFAKELGMIGIKKSR